MINFSDKVKRYFQFSKEEYRSILSTVIVFGFILGFTQWGAAEFNVVEGLKNWLVAAIISLIVLFVHHAAQRLAALYWGFKSEQRIWMPGLLIGLLFVFLSNGNVQIFAASRTFIEALPAHRLGKRRGPDLKTHGTICMLGPVANILFAAIVYVLYYIYPSAFLSKLATFSLVFALWNLLPVPPLDGGKMFFASRLAYSWFAGAIIGFIGFVWILNFSIILSVILSIIVGSIFWLFVWVTFERLLS